MEKQRGRRRYRNKATKTTETKTTATKTTATKTKTQRRYNGVNDDRDKNDGEKYVVFKDDNDDDNDLGKDNDKQADDDNKKAQQTRW